MADGAVATKIERPRRLAQVAADGSLVEIPANPLLGMLGQLATSPNFNPEAFRMIVDLIREEKSEAARNEFRDAFAAFQKDAPAVERKGTGHNSKKYARLEDVIEAVRPTLSANGFSLHHTIKQEDGKIRICAVLGHRAGHAETTEIVLPLDASGNKNAVQAHASSVTYGRRYTALALLGIAPEDEDDDGKAAAAPETISDEQVAQLRSLIVETNSDIAKFCAMGGVQTLEEIKAADFNGALKLLQQKQRKAAK